MIYTLCNWGLVRWNRLLGGTALPPTHEYSLPFPVDNNIGNVILTEHIIFCVVLGGDAIPLVKIGGSETTQILQRKQHLQNNYGMDKCIVVVEYCTIVGWIGQIRYPMFEDSNSDLRPPRHVHQRWERAQLERQGITHLFNAGPALVHHIRSLPNSLTIMNQWHEWLLL